MATRWAAIARRAFRALALGLVLLLPTARTMAALWNDATSLGPLAPAEQQLLTESVESQLTNLELLPAALVASGVENSQALHNYEARYRVFVDELRQSGRVQGTPRQQAEAVFDFLHQRILWGGYRIDGTDLRLAFDEGVFNCVSASILFQCLASEFGLTVRGLEVPTHAMSRLVLPNGVLDVETTCPTWFKLSEAQKAALRSPNTALDKTTSRRNDGMQERVSRDTAAASGAVAREVSPPQLLAMIYYNRGVDLLGERRFAEALAANAKALRLDPSNTTARGNFLATLNNWAIELAAAQHYAQAADLLCQGMALDPHYQTFVLNYEHVCHQWTENLCRAGQCDKAISVLREAVERQPQRPYFRKALDDIYRLGSRDNKR